MADGTIRKCYYYVSWRPPLRRSSPLDRILALHRHNWLHGIEESVKRRKLLPLIDFAYQGIWHRPKRHRRVVNASPRRVLGAKMRARSGIFWLLSTGWKPMPR
jgi:hypothetical protein